MSDSDTEDVLKALRDDPEKVQVLLREFAKREASDRIYSASAAYRDALRTLYGLLVEETERFRPGELVRWKQGLRNKTYPYEESVGIVIEHRETSLSVDRDPGSIYFQEPTDLAIGILAGTSDERTFVVYWFDSRRFERVTERDNGE